MSDPSVPPPHAGVRFPPPFVYVAGFALGWLLHRWRPIPITNGTSTGREIAAAIALLLYVVLFATALAAFRRARTTLIPNRPAVALVTAGPYRVTRNPMYLSLVALYVGLTRLLNSWGPVLLLPLVVVAIDRTVIAREERYLASAFPTEYPPYRARVRRWL